MNRLPLLTLIPAALGNNRAVINGTTGAVEQTVAYYPFGGVIADLGTPAGGQPYKFGGKELLTANGLNEYDLGRDDTTRQSRISPPLILSVKTIIPYLHTCIAEMIR